MLLSIAYVLMVGMAAGWLCRKLHLPSLAGMILTGIVLGPYVLDLIDGSILGISAELRKIALIIILMRAGLSLDVDDLKRVGRPAILMCFVPACFEIVGMVALAPRLLGISMLEAAIMGSVVAAVSPAVVVPKMIRLMEEGYGTENSIPQLILAGASVDDVFVIVLFSVFTGLAQGAQVSAASFVQIPLSILAGILIGAAVGILLAVYFKKMHIRDTVKVIILLCISFVLVSLEDSLKGVFSFSSLISVMCMGIPLSILAGILIGAAVGRGGDPAVCAGGCNCGYKLRRCCWGRGCSSDPGRAGISHGRGNVLSCGNKAESEGADVLHGGVYAKGHGTGRHRRSASVHGAGLRKYCAHRGCAGNPDHSAAGSLSCGSHVPEMADTGILKNSYVFLPFVFLLYLPAIW